MADIKTITVNGTTYNIVDAGAERTSHKSTSISSQSTDEQYPSAKAVNDKLQNVGGIIVQATVPPGNASQLWVDTGHGSIAKYWNGSAWVTVKAVWG